jgi:hypothetical protein
MHNNFSLTFQIKMARSHHRKKHKHFQPPPHTVAQKRKRNGSIVFAVAGGVIALIIVYSVAKDSLAWIIAGALVGAGIGFLIGRSFDR